MSKRKRPDFRAEDMDNSIIEMFKVQADGWNQLVVSVTDENDIPVSAYLSLKDAARAYEFLGQWLKEQS